MWNFEITLNRPDYSWWRLWWASDLTRSSLRETVTSRWRLSFSAAPTYHSVPAHTISNRSAHMLGLMIMYIIHLISMYPLCHGTRPPLRLVFGPLVCTPKKKLQCLIYKHFSIFFLLASLATIWSTRKHTHQLLRIFFFATQTDHPCSKHVQDR